jgi:hypothetical protein
MMKKFASKVLFALEPEMDEPTSVNSAFMFYKKPLKWGSLRFFYQI